MYKTKTMDFRKTIFVLVLFLTFSLAASAQTIESYVEQYSDLAKELSETHNIPASIILGIAIHESAAGKSKIARHLNNHFGFKGKNSSKTLRSSYKDFPTVDSSYNYFITFLKSRSKFNGLFDKLDRYDYKAWARGIRRGGYATNRAWASHVINVIKKYELYQFDNRPEDYVEPVAPVVAQKVAAKKTKTYTVKSGDTLSSIAKKNKTTVKSIKAKNRLKSDLLSLGQRLKL